MQAKEPRDSRVWPKLGLGTWRMGESSSGRQRDIAAVRDALEIGYRLIDTAEMYGDGGAESCIGEALSASIRAGDIRREQLTLVSKVYPHHADARGVRLACDRSRQRLGVDTIDVYLLHWRGAVPLRETILGFEDLQSRGWINSWGVSNFDVDDLLELRREPGGHRCCVNQIYYSLGARGIEFDLLPWARRNGMPVMAYSPIDQGVLAGDARLQSIARQSGVSAAQVALAWAMRNEGVVAIPKASRREHLQANFSASSLCLDRMLLDALDQHFPPPRKKVPLAMT